MTMTKTHHNMLFMLAALACGQGNSKSDSTSEEETVSCAAISDVSDDETSTTSAASPAKDIVVSRRRRRPLKKRRLNDEYLSSAPLLFLGSSIKPRKSLLGASINVVGNSSVSKSNSVNKSKATRPAHVESRDEKPVVLQIPNQNNDETPSAAHHEMPSLVPDDSAWKDVHSPLDLPNFLPCPAIALKNVKSINLVIE